MPYDAPTQQNGLELLRRGGSPGGSRLGEADTGIPSYELARALDRCCRGAAAASTGSWRPGT
jgi:hypothetical protein